MPLNVKEVTIYPLLSVSLCVDIKFYWIIFYIYWSVFSCDPTMEFQLHICLVLYNNSQILWDLGMFSFLLIFLFVFYLSQLFFFPSLSLFPFLFSTPLCYPNCFGKYLFHKPFPEQENRNTWKLTVCIFHIHISCLPEGSSNDAK